MGFGLQSLKARVLPQNTLYTHKLLQRFGNPAAADILIDTAIWVQQGHRISYPSASPIHIYRNNLNTIGVLSLLY